MFGHASSVVGWLQGWFIFIGACFFGVNYQSFKFNFYITPLSIPLTQ